MVRVFAESEVAAHDLLFGWFCSVLSLMDGVGCNGDRVRGDTVEFLGGAD
jgi:hypothetical protein